MRKILIYIIVLLLAICTYLSVSYAYYTATIGTRQNMTTSVSIYGCISLNVTTQINISGDKAVPVSDARALTNTSYRSAFTIYNNCSAAKNVEIAFAPGPANTMPINAIKYALYEQGATVPTAGTALSTNKIGLYDTVISQTTTAIGEAVEYAYKISNTVTIPAKGSKAYYLNTWIDYSEGGGGNLSTADKTVRLHLLAAEEGELGAPLLSEWLAESAPRSGIDAVSSSPWILTEDHTGEWRYAGRNPDNYIQFNGELWRIIGLMPNMTYCTGTYNTTAECNTTATGSLVKIIRNASLGGFYYDSKQTGVGSSTTLNGSNDWSDSQLMLMLNGTHYLKTAYDINNAKLHNNYVVSNDDQKTVYDNGMNHGIHWSILNYFDDDGTTNVYKPSVATTNSYSSALGTVSSKIASTSINQIATARWYLYGTSSYTTAAEGTASVLYNKERNINSTGTLFNSTSAPENRPAYWYGKIGLIYPSDFGYATNGNGTDSGNYSRSGCLEYQMSAWNGDYKTYCTGNDWIWYNNITSTAGSTGIAHWMISPDTSSAFKEFVGLSDGSLYTNTVTGNNYPVVPVLYLNNKLFLAGGTGKWNDPYTIE